MLKAIEIEGFKSIESVKINLGRVNVFIGENGAGKSNILEAVALAGAAEARKLDNEFLVARGIRVSDPSLMRPMFRSSASKDNIKISIVDSESRRIDYILNNDNLPYSSWSSQQNVGGLPLVETDMPIISEKVIERLGDKEKAVEAMRAFADLLLSTINSIDVSEGGEKLQNRNEIRLENDLAAVGQIVFGQSRLHYESHRALQDFVVFSPENTALRTLEREGQIEPLGVNGEGLSKLLQVMANDTNQNSIKCVKKGLRLFNWFDDFFFLGDNDKISERILLRDNYISADVKDFDQRSVNEGFLFVSFYLALFASRLTPKIFAVDNIDASLNPKLCERLMRELVGIATEADKQVLLTTHNPSILDGLDLNDMEQKLFVVSRTDNGSTSVRLVEKKSNGSRPVRLSNAFLNGALGGVPRNF